MPQITALNLMMSRDTNGVVTVRVDYVLKFTETEVGADISFGRDRSLTRLGHRKAALKVSAARLRAITNNDTAVCARRSE